MYDFLISEVWWMETIIASGISAFVAVFLAWLAYRSKINRILENGQALAKQQQADHDRLSGEHGDLSKELIGVSHEISSESKERAIAVAGLLAMATDTQKTVRDIHTATVAEQAKREANFQQLGDRQKEISVLASQSASSITQLGNELLRLNNEHSTLRATHSKLNEEYMRLLGANSQLSQQCSDLREQNSSLVQLIKTLKEQPRGNPRGDSRQALDFDFGPER